MKKILYFLPIIGSGIYAMNPVLPDQCPVGGGIYITGNVTVEGNLDAPAVVCAMNGDLNMHGSNASLGYAKVGGDDVDIKMDKFLSRATKFCGKKSITVDADHQINETVIRKSVQHRQWGKNYADIEEIAGIDEDEFISPKIKQKGEYIENIGIHVMAGEYEDQGKFTSNIPAQTTLYNHVHTESRKFLSTNKQDVYQIDDVLVPARYEVDQFKSINAESGPSEVQFGDTFIRANANIISSKDKHKDVAIQERHEQHVHSKTSGFSIGNIGRARAENPIPALQSIRSSIRNNNMVGLATSTISAVAQAKRLCENVEQVGEIAKNLNKMDVASVLNVNTLIGIAEAVAPSATFGTTTVDIHQKETITHGNKFQAREKIEFNNVETKLIGNFQAQEISIDTEDLETAPMPHTIESSVSVHQTGVSFNPVSAIAAGSVVGAGAAIAGGSINVSHQDTKSSATEYVPTRFNTDKFQMKVKNAYLPQTQIKSNDFYGEVENNLTMETLANEYNQESSGYSVSASLGAPTNVTSALSNIGQSAIVSHVDAGSRKKAIGEHAGISADNTFYLDVGETLHTKSAFVGQKDHDQSREYKKAGRNIEEQTEEFSEEWDNSFTLSMPDTLEVKSLVNSICMEEIQNEIDAGFLDMEDAEQTFEEKATAKEEEINQEEEKISAVGDKVDKILKETKEKVSKEQSNEKKAEAIVSGLKKIGEERARLANKRPGNNTQECSRETQDQLLAEAYREQLNELAKLETKAKKERADIAVRNKETEIRGMVSLETLSSLDLTISPTGEAAIRKEAEEAVSQEFAEIRKNAAAEYNAQCRFFRGEDAFSITSFGGSDEDRFNRLRQEELSKIGESDIQNIAGYVPFVGSVMDYHYDKISGLGLLSGLAVDTATFFVPGGKGAVAAEKAAVQSVKKTAISQFRKKLSRTITRGNRQIILKPRSKTNVANISSKVVSPSCKATEEVGFRGGSYDSLKVINKPHNIERHHIPADSVSGVSRGRGMAIQMDAADHAKTSSFRNSSSAQKYRKEIKSKIDAGDMRGAVATEIWDVKKATGSKYNQALNEMLTYGKNSKIIPGKK